MTEEMNEFTRKKCVIKIVGAGGGGGNAINRMIDNGLDGVDFCAMNTDLQVLNLSRANKRIQLGALATKGLGAGGNPLVGEHAAEESKEAIKEYLTGADMVFITAGMGGGTGTGSIPVIAKIAQELGILTVAVVTKPFSFEGKRRMKQANDGIEKLKDHVDSMIIIHNNKLYEAADKKVSFENAFLLVDEVLARAVAGITCTITHEGLINIDFADIKAIMEKSENAIMAIGVSNGSNRAVEAVNKAMHSVNLNELSMENATNARGLIVNIVADSHLTLQEVYDAMNVIEDFISDETNIKVGAVIDPKLRDSFEVNIIAAGFSDIKPSLETVKINEILKPTDTFFKSVELPFSNN